MKQYDKDLLNLFAIERHNVSTPDSHVGCTSIKDFEKVKFCQGFWIKKVFFKNFVFRG